MIVKDFEFYVGGIEDAIIQSLRDGCEYARDVSAYSGELDEENLRRALEEMSSRFPLFLVSYTDGQDRDRGALGPEVIGAPREIRHDCTFSVICCDDNARGEQARRRGAPGSVGVFQMISDAREILSRVQFELVEEGERHLLNPEPLNPAGIEHIAHLPAQTAYVQHFDTFFIVTTPDRRTPGAQVKEIVIDTNLNATVGVPLLPGVTNK
ncbi:MAG: phage protein Gp37 [Pyrinomonadaceae bacterium]